MKLKLFNDDGSVKLDSSDRTMNIVAMFIDLPSNGTLNFSLPDMSNVDVHYIWAARQVSYQVSDSVWVENGAQNKPELSLTGSGNNWNLQVTMRYCGGNLIVIDRK